MSCKPPNSSIICLSWDTQVVTSNNFISEGKLRMDSSFVKLRVRVDRKRLERTVLKTTLFKIEKGARIEK